MTEITEGEIRRFYLQVVIMGILGVFFFFYASAPATSQTSQEKYYLSSTDVKEEDAGFMENIISPDAGTGAYLPGGAAEIIIVSSIILIPLTIMNTFTAIRFIKDMMTQWI